MTETIEQNVRAREASNTLVELGIALAKDEGLSPAAVRHMWECVLDTVAQLIGGDKVISSAVVIDGGERPSFQIADLDCPADDDLFPFGEHKGESYGDVPDNYYGWLAKQDWIDRWPPVVAYIQAKGLD